MGILGQEDILSQEEDSALDDQRDKGRVHDPDTDLLVRSDPLETDCHGPVGIYHRHPLDIDLSHDPLDNDPLVQGICQLMDNRLEMVYL